MILDDIVSGARSFADRGKLELSYARENIKSFLSYVTKHPVQTSAIVMAPVFMDGCSSPTEIDPPPPPPTEVVSSYDAKINPIADLMAGETVDLGGDCTVTLRKGTEYREVTPDATVLIVNGEQVALAPNSSQVSTTHGPLEPGNYSARTECWKGLGTDLNPSNMKGASSPEPFMATPPPDNVSVISGRIENNETDVGMESKVRIYDPDGNFLDEADTNASGEFSVEVAAFSSYIVQAAKWDNGQEGYVRTVRPGVQNTGDDISDLLIRAVPFDGLAEAGVSVDDFYQHMDEVNFNGNMQLFNHDGLTRLDIENFKEVYIYQTNEETENSVPKGSYTLAQQQYVQSKWVNPDMIPVLFGGNTLNIIIGQDGDVNKPAALNNDGWLVPETGYGIILPDSTMTGAGRTSVVDEDGDGLFESFKMRINWEEGERIDGYDHSLIHEGGRAAGMATAFTLPHNKTVTTGGAGPTLLSEPHEIIDPKTGFVAYEVTFAPLEKIDDVMSKEFLH
ncbi:hypothetical protein ACFL1B_05700 [Nanoarchaeota archaeon]